MATVVNKSNLGYLGKNFQYKLVNAFMKDQNFFRDFESIIDQNVFSEYHLRVIVGILKEYYSEYGYLPSYDMLQIKLYDKANNEDDRQLYDETLEKMQNQPNHEMNEVEGMAERFFKQQYWIRIANEITKTAGDGDLEKYDTLEGLIKKANSVGNRQSDFFNPLDDVDNCLTPENSVFVPTGIEDLDDVLGGGLEKGKLGLIISPSGCGKTSITTGMAAFAATMKTSQNHYEGYKVIQIVFEDTKRDLSRKYFGRISQIETCNLDNNITEVKNILQNYKDKELIKNNIRIFKCSTGVTSSKDILNTIENQIAQGFVPDLVIVDYFECLELDGHPSENEWSREGKTMRKFENMASELNIAMWIPIQGGKDSMTAQIVTMDKGSGSVKKVQIGQVIISIARPFNGDSKLQNEATIALLKNRGGRAGISFEVEFNNGTCTVSSKSNVSFDKSFDVDDLNDDDSEFDEEKARRILMN